MSMQIATSLDEVLAALAAGARPIAGGTDLVVGHRRVAQPPRRGAGVVQVGRDDDDGPIGEPPAEAVGGSLPSSLVHRLKPIAP